MSSQQACLKLCCVSEVSCAPRRACWGKRPLLCCGFLLFPLGPCLLAPLWQLGVLHVTLSVCGSAEDRPAALEGASPHNVVGKPALRVLTEQHRRMESVEHLWDQFISEDVA